MVWRALTLGLKRGIGYAARLAEARLFVLSCPVPPDKGPVTHFRSPHTGKYATRSSTSP